MILSCALYDLCRMGRGVWIELRSGSGLAVGTAGLTHFKLCFVRLQTVCGRGCWRGCLNGKPVSGATGAEGCNCEHWDSGTLYSCTQTTAPPPP